MTHKTIQGISCDARSWRQHSTGRQNWERKSCQYEFMFPRTKLILMLCSEIIKSCFFLNSAKNHKMYVWNKAELMNYWSKKWAFTSCSIRPKLPNKEVSMILHNLWRLPLLLCTKEGGWAADVFVIRRVLFSGPHGGLDFENGTRPKLQPCEKIYPTV